MSDIAHLSCQTNALGAEDSQIKREFCVPPMNCYTPDITTNFNNPIHKYCSSLNTLTEYHHEQCLPSHWICLQSVVQIIWYVFWLSRFTVWDRVRWCDVFLCAALLVLLERMRRGLRVGGRKVAPHCVLWLIGFWYLSRVEWCLGQLLCHVVWL